MQESKVPIRAQGLDIHVQGFRGNEEHDINPYVYVGVHDGEAWIKFEGDITPENAQILGEELRKHAEYATSVAEQGE